MKGVRVELTPPLTAPKHRKRKRSASLNGDPPGRFHTQSYAKIPSTSLYDHISHILLEEDALKELDNRNRLIPSPAPLSPASETSSVPQRQHEVSTELQRFARAGSLDVTDLRGYTLPAPKSSTSKNIELAEKRKADPQCNEQPESQKSRKTDATGA
ncbi:MAG: hypothetical protein Q9195_002823 [Heterodermia aff. obscurata]